MKVEADAGTQTRLFHFGDWKAPGGAPTLQGDTTAQWETGARGRGGQPPPPPMFGNLKTVTTNLRPGYLRKNGVPYSDKTTLTEYWDLLQAAERRPVDRHHDRRRGSRPTSRARGSPASTSRRNPTGRSGIRRRARRK